ncbi:MAG: hypothetical protein AAGA54_04300 [Myxococcota bacterium]
MSLTAKGAEFPLVVVPSAEDAPDDVPPELDIVGSVSDELGPSEVSSELVVPTDVAGFRVLLPLGMLLSLEVPVPSESEDVGDASVLRSLSAGFGAKHADVSSSVGARCFAFIEILFCKPGGMWWSLLGAISCCAIFWPALKNYSVQQTVIGFSAVTEPPAGVGGGTVHLPGM